MTNYKRTAKNDPGKLTGTNTFEDGLVADLHDMSVPASALSDVANMEFITESGGQYVLQNIKGDKLASALPQGYTPLAVKEYRNIAYIISGKFDPETGAFIEGAIGSYPSPDWENMNKKDAKPGDNYA
ncbi:MAG: hypothetical protein KAH32_06090, partial [Chlamydiia bacterium]|nr:hypothetical protein [Chlamydiia bacterium]